MKEALFRNTEIASYFLWEHTKHTNALDLWYCAEDIGFLLVKKKIFKINDVQKITGMPRSSFEYIDFVRHLAFRLYIFTNNSDRLHNWYTAEKLLANSEWLNAVLMISTIYDGIKEGRLDIKDSIRTERIKKEI